MSAAAVPQPAAQKGTPPLPPATRATIQPTTAGTLHLQSSVSAAPQRVARPVHPCSPHSPPRHAGPVRARALSSA
jgi:hypothetical protein